VKEGLAYGKWRDGVQMKQQHRAFVARIKAPKA